MKLGIDIDGCLANFNMAFGDLLVERTGKNLLPDGWKADPFFPSTWNWHYAAGYTPEEADKVWKEGIDESSTFWYNLAPYPDAPDTLRQLSYLSKMGHEVYFLTHRTGIKVKQQTENWLKEHGMEHPTVLISGNKVPVLDGLDIQFFIDDKLSTVQQAHLHYEANRREGIIILKDAPYNRKDRPLFLNTASSVEIALKECEIWQEPKRGRPKNVRS